MASKQQTAKSVKTVSDVVAEVGLYPQDAFEFVQQGLCYSVERIFGSVELEDDSARHVSGQQLCEGLRQYALLQWGLMARSVLRRWKITSTLDFGRIVFAMIEAGQMHKTPTDSVDDFRDVYEFRTSFEHGYRISCKPLVA